MKLTLTLRRVAKNGIAVYKYNTKRASGTVYLDKKMFVGEAPQTIEVEAANLAEPQADAPKAAKPEATADAPTADAPVAETSAVV